MEAIRDVGGRLVVACDPHDSIGILDRLAPGCSYFPESERFDRHLDVLRRRGEGLDYLSICSPNYLHDAHIRLALRNGAEAICEKPITINPWGLTALENLEQETGLRIWTVLQLRLLPSVLALRKQLNGSEDVRKVTLDYITPRGPWYNYSWKGNAERSGGILANIGIHLFDLLIHLFGSVEEASLLRYERDRAYGELRLERARVAWRLSIRPDDLPPEAVRLGQPSWRLLTIDGDPLELTAGFTDLHTEVYRRIVAGEGTGIEHARPSVELVHQLRRS